MLTRNSQPANSGESDESIDLQAVSEPTNRSFVSILIVLFLIGIAGAFAYFANNHEKKPADAALKKPAIVRVAVVSKQNVPMQLKAVGHVEPLATVSVRSRVEGELVDVLFAEGDRVRVGQPLFTIDPRPLDEAIRQTQAKVAQARADVSKCRSLINKDKSELLRLAANRERDLAEEANAKRDWTRYAELVKEGAVSVEQENRYGTNVSSLIATVKADAAAMENQKAVIQSDIAQLESAQAALKSSESDLVSARLQRTYCSITAPMDGKTGSLLVHRGQMVKAGDASSLVVINRVKPVYVNFSVPEQELPRIQELQKIRPLEIGIEGLGARGRNVVGHLTFIDNSVQRNTGTILLKGTFPNLDEVLWPGTYVTAVLNLDVKANALVVPSHAIQVGQLGQYVYVVGEDSKAHLEVIKTTYTFGDMCVVEGNLKPGDRVVIDGHMQLMPNAPVEVQGPGNLPK